MTANSNQLISKQFNWQERLADLYIGLLLSVFVLYPGTHGYYTIGTSKTTLALWLAGGYIVLAVILQINLFLTGSSVQTEMTLWKEKWSPIKLLVILYLLWSLLATVSAGKSAWHGISRGEGYWTIIIYCLSFILLSTYAKSKGWMAYVFGISMSFNAIIALLQMKGFNPLHLYPDGLNYFDANQAYNGIYLGLTGNADFTSALFAMAVAFFSVILWKGSSNMRYLLVVPLLLCLKVLLQCRVAAGYVSLIGAVLLGIPVLVRKKQSKCIAWCISSLIALAVLLILIFWTPEQGTLNEFHQILHGQIDDKFGSGRILIWRQVLQHVPKHLMLGVGPDMLSSLHLKGESWVDPSTGVLIQYEIDHAHNEYLNLLISQGLPAMLFYIFSLLITGIGWLKWASYSPILAACGTVVLINSIQVFFGFSLSPTGLIFWAFWAFTEQKLQERKRKMCDS